MSKLKTFFNQQLFSILLVLILFSLFLLTTWSGWQSHLFGDDWPNSMVKPWILYLYGIGGFEGFIQQTFEWTRGWAEGQGRFFPFAVMTTKASFIFLSIEQYRILKYFCIALLLLVSGVAFSKILQSKNLIFFGILGAISTVQFRNDYDPYLGFTMLLPLATIHTLVGGLLLGVALKKKRLQSKLGFSLLSSLFYFAGLTTYEYAIFIFPVSIFIGLVGLNLKEIKKNFIYIFISVLPIFTTLMYTFLILRPSRVNNLASYELAFNPIASFKAFSAQFLASIPVSQVIFKVDAYPHLQDKLRLLLVLTLVIAFILLSLRVQFKEIKNFRLLILFAITLWVSPAILVSLTSRWQGESALSIGQAYLPILIQNVGVSWLVGLVLFWSRNQILSLIRIGTFKFQMINQLKIILSFMFIGLFSFAVSILISTNNAKTKNGNWQKERMDIFAGALSNGLANYVNSGDRVISWEQNDAFEINRGIFKFYSKKDISSLNHPYELWTTDCIGDLNCDLSEKFIELSNTQQLLGKNPNYNENVSHLVNLYRIQNRLARVTINKPSDVYYLDATFFPGGGLFTLAPMESRGKDVVINRSQTYLFWYRIADRIGLPAKEFGEGLCVQAPQINPGEKFVSLQLELKSQDLRSLRNTPVGFLC